ncbi:integrating conjugative element protein, PFL_4693 family [Proteus mirabilis]|uniref:Integrating conjugative element protein, PFL_4693 family n=1 Tax=Proteus mirabilis TaxID=584 RepID=A0A2X2BP52_PROMI|nr:integrating conjugative element protein, PFL_4693 family [Proteus mirabilis]
MLPGSGSMVRYYRSVWEHSAGWNREQRSAGRHCLCRRKIVARVMPVWLLLLAGKQPFDIYVLGTKGDDNRLRAWARQKNIPAERVRKREITLNHDGGLSLQYGLTTTPVVMQQLPGWAVASAHTLIRRRDA